MKPMKKLLSFLLALSLLLGMAPQLALTARAADASEYLITAPILNKTAIYFNGQEQGDFITPGVAKEGYEIRYSLSDMLFYAPSVSMMLPSSRTVSYAIYDQGATFNTKPVSNYVELGRITMHRAIPQYVTRPTAINADAASWTGVPLVTAGTTNLPDYFAVEYKVGTGNWSKDIPKAIMAGTFTVQYRLAALQDRFAITQIQGMDADELLDLSNRQEGSVQVTIGKPANVTAPVANTSLMYSGQKLQLLASPAVTDVGSIQYSVTDASATAPGTWSADMPAATNAGDYKVWYKANFTDINQLSQYFSEPAFVTVSIGKQTPAVTSWPSSSIYVGDTLDNSHLTGGSANVNGTFSVGAGQSWATAGTYSTEAVFTPADTTNYTCVTGSASITVNKRIPGHVVDPAPITMPYGTSQDALGLPAAVDLVTADGKTYPVPVTWTGYDPEPGALGTQTLTGALDLSQYSSELDTSKVLTASIQVELTNRNPGVVNYADKTVPYTGEVISHELESLPQSVASVSYYYEGDHTLPGTYPVTASFTMKPFYSQLGDATSQLNITNAELANVSVAQTGTLTYNGQFHTPEVAASAEAKGGQTVTFTYGLAAEGPFGDLPSFDQAGTYTVFYKASAQYHNDAHGTFTVTVNKQEVTPPTIAGKVYNGQVQTADVPASDLYAVSQNDGGTEGGEYDVVLTLTDSTNYCWSNTSEPSLTLKFNITAADNAWTAEPSIGDWTYGEAPSDPNFGETAYGTAQVHYTGTTNAGAAYEGTDAPKEAGEYKAVFTVPGTGSYGGLTKEVPFSVKRAPLPTDRGLSYTEPADLVYSGLEQSVSVTTTLPGVDAQDITLNYSAAPKNAGDYTFTVSVAQSDNFEAATLTNDAWKFTISKAQPTIYWDTTEFTYNAQPQGEAKITLANDEVYSGTIRYSYDGSTEGLPTNVGTYWVTAAIDEQDNYLAANKRSQVTIRIRTVTEPTVLLTPDSYTYDGQPKQPAVKVLDGETEIPAKEYTVLYQENTNAGDALVTIQDKDGGNYVVNSTASFAIRKADSVLSAAPTGKSGLVYTGTAQNLIDPGTASGGTLVYRLSQNESFSQTIPTGTNAGDYTVYYKVMGNHNYNEIPEQSLTVTISKAVPVCTEPTGLTAAYGQTLAHISLTAADGDTPGHWQWTAPDTQVQVINNGYAVQFVPDDTANYSTVDRTVKVAVAPMKLTVSGVEAQSKIYDGKTDAEAAVTFQEIPDSLKSGEDYTLTAAFADANAGTGKQVKVTLRVLNSNYIQEEQSFTAAADIMPRNVTPTVDIASENLTYNGKAHTPKVTVRDGTAVIPTSEYFLTYHDNVNAGQGYVRIENVSGNYMIPKMEIPFSIAKKEVIIAAESKTIYAGEKLPELSYTVKGLLEGEHLLTLPKLSTTADKNKAGTYAINITGADAGSNYVITYSGGSLQVLARPAAEQEEKPKPATKPSKQEEAPKPVTVPITNEENTTIHVQAEVKAHAATIKDFDVEKLNQVVGDHVETVGTVTVDFSDLKQNIETVNIPTAAIAHIAEAAADAGNDTEKLEIILDKDISIEFDAIALNHKIEQAEEKDVTITVQPENRAKDVTREQKKAVSNRPAYQVQIHSGDEHITEIDGEVAVSVAYELKKGEVAEGLKVYAVDEQGNLTLCEAEYDPVTGRIRWKTIKHSLYVIAYEEPTEEISDDAVPEAHSPIRPGSPEKSGSSWLLWLSAACLSAAAALGAYLLFLLKKPGKFQK